MTRRLQVRAQVLLSQPVPCCLDSCLRRNDETASRNPTHRSFPLPTKAFGGQVAAGIHLLCQWAGNEPSIRYHDEEWGVPVHDDRVLFDFLLLEGEPRRACTVLAGTSVESMRIPSFSPAAALLRRQEIAGTVADEREIPRFARDRLRPSFTAVRSTTKTPRRVAS